MRKKVDESLAEEGEAAENYDIPEEMPPHVEVSRPNLGKATVVSVRLSSEEYRRLHHAANEANLPVSTVIRVWALDRLRAEEQGTGASITERLARLERAVFQRSA